MYKYAWDGELSVPGQTPLTRQLIIYKFDNVHKYTFPQQYCFCFWKNNIYINCDLI